MTVYQLNRDELTELKQRYYSKIHTNISYSEMTSIDTLVTDNEIYVEYSDTTFTLDDFFCDLNNEARREEVIFESNLEYYKQILEDTKDYIDSYSKGDLTLKEVGEKYSKELANIMFDLLYASWYFKDLGNLKYMKNQMAETIRDDYDVEEIRSNRKKEDIIKEIYEIKENEYLREVENEI